MQNWTNTTATPHLQPFDSEGTWLRNRHSRHIDPVIHEAGVSAEFGARKGSHEPQKTMKNNEALMALSHLQVKGIDVLDIAAAPLLRILPRAPSSQLSNLSGCWPAKMRCLRILPHLQLLSERKIHGRLSIPYKLDLTAIVRSKCSREPLYLNSSQLFSSIFGSIGFFFLDSLDLMNKVLRCSKQQSVCMSHKNHKICNAVNLA
jgi:hypothetical protein